MTHIFDLPSPSSSINCSTPKNNDVLRQQTRFLNHHASFINDSSLDLYMRNNCRRRIQGVEAEEEGEVSVLAVLVTVFRRFPLAGCNSKISGSFGVKEQLMEVGLPTDVRHVAHVTFDRFNGFLGLPVEFEPEVPRMPPSASTRVFGVSTDSMQLSFDSRGNCVPTILLMMQRRLYEQGGLQSEGIFRINPENSQEEHVREQLNNGVISDDIDVHCLAGLVKAWFRELPDGILDSLPPEQVMEAQSEDECACLVKLLPPTEGALLDWAINLMADVAQFEHSNKMNARNIAMVFAPNMTHMSDPLTALMFAVQVMNFLKTLVEKALREREDWLAESGPMLPLDPSDGDGHYSNAISTNEKKNEEDKINIANGPLSESSTDDQDHGFQICSMENVNDNNTPADDPNSLGSMNDDEMEQGGHSSVGIGKNQPARRRRAKNGQPSNNRIGARRKGSRKYSTSRLGGEADDDAETKKKEPNIVRRANSHAKRVEAWR